jgi:hypothetical protein
MPTAGPKIVNPYAPPTAEQIAERRKRYAREDLWLRVTAQVATWALIAVVFVFGWWVEYHYQAMLAWVTGKWGAM